MPQSEWEVEEGWLEETKAFQPLHIWSPLCHPPSHCIFPLVQLSPLCRASHLTPQQVGEYKQPKGSPISYASISLPPDCANSHADPDLFLELSLPVFKLSLLTPQTPRYNPAPQQAAYSLMLLKSRQPTQNVAGPLHHLPRVNSDKITSLTAGQRGQRSLKIHQQESSRRSGKTLSDTCK